MSDESLHPASQTEPATPSLWRELADGSAGWVVRLVVTFALAVALIGLVPLLAYLFAATVPSWGRPNPYGIYVSEQLMAFLAAVAAGGFLAATAWLWTRSQRRRAIATPVVLTIGVVIATIFLSVWAEDSLPGDRELVVFGLVFVALAAVILIWLNALRDRGPRWRALRDRRDGLPDVRCPTCDYRMVGLTESRCPECGTAYTLDELIARQQFAPIAPSAPQSAPAPTPPALKLG